MTPFVNHIWCLDHLDGLTRLSCISRLTKMSKMTNTFYILLMTSPHQVNTYRCQRQDKYKGSKDLSPTT